MIEKMKLFLIGFAPMFLIIMLIVLLSMYPKVLLGASFILIIFLFSMVCISLGDLIIELGIVDRLKKLVNK